MDARSLIVGPNGSGKSTIVCAMCLGLGGDPKLLGRGDKPGDYVRTGQCEATIQVSIATGEDDKTTMVQRKITKDDPDDEKTVDDWKIDGRSTTKAAVKDFVHKEMNIQLDNFVQL